MTKAAQDAKRMDWLEKQYVQVRAPMRYGSREMFSACPQEVEGLDDDPSDLRAQIDAAMGNASQHGQPKQEMK